MKSKLTVRFFSGLWTASLLLATMGLSVHALYCYCLGKTTYSLLAPAQMACQKQEEVKSCCQLPAKEVLTPQCCAAKKTIKKNKCSKSTTEVVALHPDMQVENGTVWMAVSVLALSPAILPAFQLFTTNNAVAASSYSRPPPDNTAVPSGWQICLLNEVFRC